MLEKGYRLKIEERLAVELWDRRGYFPQKRCSHAPGSSAIRDGSLRSLNVSKSDSSIMQNAQGWGRATAELDSGPEHHSASFRHSAGYGVLG